MLQRTQSYREREREREREGEKRKKENADVKNSSWKVSRADTLTSM